MTIHFTALQRDPQMRVRTEQCFAILESMATCKKPEQSRLKSETDASEEKDEAIEKPVKELLALIEQGIYVNAQYDSGCSLLHLATSHSRVAQALIKRGANVNARDNKGVTPLMKAFENIEMAALHLFIPSGANQYAADNDGTTFMDTMKRKNRNLDGTDKYSLVKFRKEYAHFQETGMPPQTAEEVYLLLAAWPLSDPKGPIDQEQHLQALFSHARWENQQQAGAVLTSLRESGMSSEFCDMLQDMIEQKFAPGRVSPRPRQEGKEGLW